MKFDVNRGMEHPKSSAFTKVMIAVILIVFVGIILFLSLNGKHNIISPTKAEFNIPDQRKNSGDSIKAKNNIHMRDNNGVMYIK